MAQRDNRSDYEVLDEAAALLETSWTQCALVSASPSGTKVCLNGAVNFVNHGDYRYTRELPSLDRARRMRAARIERLLHEVIVGHPGSDLGLPRVQRNIEAWNDSDLRNKQQVLDTTRKAAKIAWARENDLDDL